jgi:hypothetical protein
VRIDRSYHHEERTYEVVVVGGGMAGICAAIAAADAGARVALIQDRPVLGGNASTEVRVGLLGANGGFHNRFFFESGLVEDIVLENLWKNPTGSADHWGALLLDRVLGTERLDLYLDTHVHRVAVDAAGAIVAVDGLTLASERSWTFRGSYFVDATGDATIAYLAGAGFMEGEESRDAFDEPLAPPAPSDDKLGGTMMLYAKDVGHPVVFEPPAFARRVTDEELRYRSAAFEWSPGMNGYGPLFWWIEYGGHLDTITDNPDIKLMLLSEVYGVWDHIKNSPGLREKNANLDLEWVGAMPGKRESRRVIGDVVLTENHIMDGTRFPDAVAYGGWSLDNHARLGFMDFDRPPCIQVHPPGVYQIPLRSLYARDVPNLYLAGRDISTSHVACCSSRVMLTCSSGGEAVGVAAALSAELGMPPRAIVEDAPAFRRLRDILERRGHHIPYVELRADRPPLGTTATASSSQTLEHIEVTETIDLSVPRMVSLPLVDDALDSVELWIQTDRPTRLTWRLFAPHPKGFWTPGDALREGSLEVPALPDGGWVRIDTDARPGAGYVHLAISGDRPDVRLGVSSERPLGPLSWRYQVSDLDALPVDRRVEDRWNLPQEFENSSENYSFPSSFWRRPENHRTGTSIAFRARPPQSPAAAELVLEPYERPSTGGVHAWASAAQDGETRDGKHVFSDPEWLMLELPDPTAVGTAEIYFNSDVDRFLPNMAHHRAGVRATRTLVADFSVAVRDPDGPWTILAEVRDNYLRRASIPVNRTIDALRIECSATHGERYASIVDVRLRR